MPAEAQGVSLQPPLQTFPRSPWKEDHYSEVQVNKYVLSPCYMPGSVLRARDIDEVEEMSYFHRIVSTIVEVL